MTLELARKRHEQGDLIDELVEALERCVPRTCQGCYLKWPYTPKSYEPVDENDPSFFGSRLVGEGDSHEFPRGGLVACSAQDIRAVIEKAKEHDCIPWDDAKEVAQR